MKKKIIFGTIMICLVVGLSACGLSGKVSKKTEKIEIGTEFNAESFFECKEGVSIKLKEGNEIDTSKTGEATATFLISDGEKTEEKDYTFKIVDTEAPQINANNITIYKDADFDPNTYAECVDNSGETITATVVSNNVDTNVEGEYFVEYEAKDSSGNSATQTVTVNVISMETAEDAMDFIDKFINENGYSELFSCSKNKYDTVFITGPYFKSYSMDSNRTLSIYPQISIAKNINVDFTRDPILEEKYKVKSIIFRMTFSDRTDDVTSRYGLYADKLIIKSGEDSITTSDGILGEDGKYDYWEFKSEFGYKFESLNDDELLKLKNMVNSGNLIFDIETKDYDDFSHETYTTVPITYEFGESDIDRLKQTLEIYDYMVDILGQFGIED